MAKIKTTELTAITAAQLADGDQIMVVDVSDTTMSSTGTNKKMAKSELDALVDGRTPTALTAHLADGVDAHDASAISNVPAGNIAATDVQAAINELDTEKVAASTLTTDGDLFTRAAGVPSRITRVDLAADAAFTTPFGITGIWLSGDQFQPGNAAGATTRPAAAINSITLDPAAIEDVTHAFRTHASWTTATVTAWYYTLASGNFLLYPTVYLAGLGETAGPSAAAGLTSPVVVTPSSVGVIQSYTFGTFTCQPAKAGQLTIMREGSAPADTNGGDFCLVGVLISKAS